LPGKKKLGSGSGLFIVKTHLKVTERKIKNQLKQNTKKEMGGEKENEKAKTVKKGIKRAKNYISRKKKKKNVKEKQWVPPLKSDGATRIKEKE